MKNGSAKNTPFFQRPIAAAALAAAVCLFPVFSVLRAAEAAGEIVIGATLSLTGPFESYGQSAYYGIQARVRKVNEAGGVGGVPLRLEVRDNHGRSGDVLSDIRELADAGAVAVVGPMFADPASEIDALSRELRIPVVSPIPSWREEEAEGTEEKPWLFRVGVAVDFEAAGIVDFQIKEFWARRCVVLHDPEHLFPDKIADAFAEKFESAGGEIVARYPLPIGSGEQDFRALIRKAHADRPDFIFCASYAIEATDIIRAARDEGIPTRFAAPYTWDNELVYEGAGRRLAGTSVSSSYFFTRGADYQPFQTFFTAAGEAGMNSPDGYAALAYDAVSLVEKALGTGRSREGVRDGLLAIRNLPLATGSVSVNPDGGARKQMVMRMVEIRNDRLTPVYRQRYDP